ncbi:MAG: acyl carrier protein [Lachnospiraceae bacterium]
MEFDKLCKIIAEVLSVDPAEVKEETTFMEDLGADSLDLYQILLKVEEEFEIKISPEAVDEIVTVGQAMDLIKKMN